MFMHPLSFLRWLNLPEYFGILIQTFRQVHGSIVSLLPQMFDHPKLLNVPRLRSPLLQLITNSCRTATWTDS